MHAYIQKSKDRSGKESQPNLSVQLKDDANAKDTGIPAQMKNNFEAASGFSFNDVKVHYNSDKPAALQARAYAQGNEVHLGPGNEKELPHELGHVVQQKKGIVKPDTSLGAVNINTDPSMERGADNIAQRAMSGDTVQGSFFDVFGAITGGVSAASSGFNIVSGLADRRSKSKLAKSKLKDLNDSANNAKAIIGHVKSDADRAKVSADTAENPATEKKAVETLARDTKYTAGMAARKVKAIERLNTKAETIRDGMEGSNDYTKASQKADEIYASVEEANVYLAQAENEAERAKAAADAKAKESPAAAPETGEATE